MVNDVVKFGKPDTILNDFYDTSKTLVFWMNIFLVMCSIITGKSRCLWAIVITILNTMAAIFQRKPLDLDQLHRDTMVYRELARRRRIYTISLMAHEKQTIVETMTQWLLSTYDLLGEKLINFMVDSKSQKCHQSTDNILLTRNHKDLSSFRNLNVIITHQDSDTEDKYGSALLGTLCTQCSHQYYDNYT